MFTYWFKNCCQTNKRQVFWQDSNRFWILGSSRSCLQLFHHNKPFLEKTLIFKSKQVILNYRNKKCSVKYSNNFRASKLKNSSRPFFNHLLRSKSSMLYQKKWCARSSISSKSLLIPNKYLRYEKALKTGEILKKVKIKQKLIKNGFKSFNHSILIPKCWLKRLKAHRLTSKPKH
jgi:hypothetical protein